MAVFDKSVQSCAGVEMETFVFNTFHAFYSGADVTSKVIQYFESKRFKIYCRR